MDITFIFVHQDYSCFTYCQSWGEFTLSRATLNVKFKWGSVTAHSVCVSEKRTMKTWSSSARRLKRPWLRMRTSSWGFMEELTWATIRKSSRLCLIRWAALSSSSDPCWFSLASDDSGLCVCRWAVSHLHCSCCLYYKPCFFWVPSRRISGRRWSRSRTGPRWSLRAVSFPRSHNPVSCRVMDAL